MPHDAPVDLADLRRAYRRAGLDEADLAPTWHQQLGTWLADALAAGVVEANAVVLATADAQGRPSSRTVLLKGYDERGLVVFTNSKSRKATEMAENPHVALTLPWVPIERQVNVTGRAERATEEEARAYWVRRPRGSQLGAWASRQSSVVPSRAVLEAARAELEERFPDDVPLPPFWGGWRVVPETVEFWQGRDDRLHDRLRYRRDGEGWVVERLSP